MQQYGLTAAPASQPRNAIVGQAVALVIAQLIGTRTDMDIWLKQSVATSLAIAVMAKLGVIHPPAGTHAVCLVWFLYCLTVFAFHHRCRLTGLQRFIIVSS